MRNMRRGDCKSNHHVLEQPKDQVRTQQEQDFHFQDSSVSPSSCHPKVSRPKSSNARRNTKWASHNSQKHGPKQVFVEKSKFNPSNSQVGSLDSEVSSPNTEPSSVGLESKKLDGFDSKNQESLNTDNSCEPEKVIENVETRLVELYSRLEEPELSEEQLRINDQQQEDELLAMESIYGDNAFILDRKIGLRYFQLHIHIEAPGAFTVTAKLTSFADQVDHEYLDDFSYSFSVQYLPPIVLTCLLPKSYPSHLPPCFTISVQWLDSNRISNLCSMLDSIWKDQAGMEIIYQWAEWLQNSSLSYLRVNREITLGPYDLKKSGDIRAISGIVSPDIDVPSLRSYNEEQCHENFQNSLHECCICYNEYAGTDFIRLPCHHFFCAKCMKTYSDLHVSEGTVNKLKCPEAKCDGMIPPGLLRRLLGDQEYEHWESLMLEKTLDSMSDVAYCPRCETACIEDKDNHAQCSKCYFNFCTLCRERRHVGTECLTPEMKLRVLEESFIICLKYLFFSCLLDH
ncbi:hypothetical protein K2173_009384 [Erythroxylum novogranatense]|uniref:RBR-type E3 ubiquitin transferase n=1 Tax=Erythroxylum novogranatense TaxID=1862640 RepID=A0AAV8U413_9ROSI|nr:hypothetical protein K2173_009384 [Erythroxylum novogranatense]